MEYNKKTVESQSYGDHLLNVSPRTVTPEIIYRLDCFFEFMPPDEFRDNLIELYHSYLVHEHEALPCNFKQLAEGMSIFLDFLKFANEELNSPRRETEPTVGEK